MRVLSVPHLDNLGTGESGIHTVIRAYFQHGPEHGIDFVPKDQGDFDVLAIHAGMSGAYPKNGNIVAHTHGLYWTADYPMGNWAYNGNAHVVDSIRHAKEITVPSSWVGETFERDMRISPHIVPHGIDFESWQHNEEPEKYIVGYAKNRAGVDVCDPSFLSDFARSFDDYTFMATFGPKDLPSNVRLTGVLPYVQMKKAVQRSLVFVNTTKETWGIAMLEAMAAGVPVLAYAHGGAVDLVQHGVNGYLARPGDMDDLKSGLAYCLKYRDTLGENGREIARNEFNWDNAMEKLLHVYELTAAPDPPTVSVIIPVYNKPASELERAIDSVKEQTLPAHEILVVDDGSDIDIDYQAIAEERGARFITQRNQGVAAARNNGIAESTGKYILCLDSDDAIAPLYLEACVPALEDDNSLGIAYTGLWWTKPDGSEGLSEWPGDFDYDRFIEGANQVPTACVFRREAWVRSGGYHSRYAPRGAGEEDANFWLRLSSLGYNARKVTTAGLFLYAWQSGQVSGAKDHAVTDWRGWLPWTNDDRHPFASVATPKKLSHPVRQYDEPAVSVIIPVGPGHEVKVRDALDSLEAQTFRKWEAIVVWDATIPPNALYEDAYPYVRNLWPDYKESRGAGHARNAGVEMARGDYLLFLDADDTLHPDCIEIMLKAYGKTGYGVYSDYVGVAIVNDTSELADNLQNNILSHDEDTKRTVIRYEAADFDCELAMKQPWGDKPYIWNNVTTLIPKVWHFDVGGFDESMVSWEDVDYWWRMAWQGKCFIRIIEPLMSYGFSTGTRRQKGIEEWDDLLEYMGSKKLRLSDGL